MSNERIIKALKGLGLSNIDVQVYVLLAKDGPHTEKEIAKMLELQERQVHRSLKSLQRIEIVKAIGRHPVQYFAVPFKDVIDLFIEVKKEQAKNMQKSKEELLSSWRNTIKEEMAES